MMYLKRLNLKSWKKNMVVTLSLGASFIMSADTFAQSRIDFGNGPIARIPRRQLPIPQKPDLRKAIVINGEEIKDLELEYQKTIEVAVAYLLKHPKEVADHIDPKLFKVIAKLVKEGKFEKLSELDKPKVVYARGDKAPKTFSGPITGLSELGGSLLDSDNEGNIKSIYGKAYSLIHPDKRRAFKSPKLIARMEKREAKLYLVKLLEVVTHYTFIPYEPTSPGWKWDCDDEIGQQRVGSGDDARRCETADFHPDSLVTSSDTRDFPLKYYHTCIKSQASRGTCVSFAINAAVESTLMVKEDKAYNFSEQFTYFYGEIYSNHSGRYSYGLNTGNALKKMDSKNVKFQYEQYWEYNPSNSMGSKSGDRYPDSCDGYNGEMCTNFAFQSQESITGWWPFKDYNYTVPYRGTSKNVQIVDTDNLWMSFHKELSLDLAISLTKVKVPLVLSFNVKQNFMDTANDGYVYHKSGEDSVGGHAAVILGYVPNSKLPAGVSPAKEKGFFIVKNSWGTWNGDCGYYYMDYKYLKKFAKGIYTVAVN